MLQKKVYFKSDFKILLESEAGWTGLPFRLKFYTGAPSRAFVACFDGTEYHNCHLHEDGRLCVAFDNHNFGFGTLRMEPTFYLNDACYRDGICDEAIPPFDVVLKDAPTEEVPEPEEYTIVLAMDGVKTLETIGTLPAFYQKGEQGEPGLTPEEHDALVQATADANAAADRANGVIDDADAAARLATAAAINADNKAAAAAEAARLADAARQQLTTTFNEKVAALEEDYAQKKAALDADYAQAKSSLAQDYAEVKGGLQSDYTAYKLALDVDYAAKKAALESDYTSVKAALSAAYTEAINGINQRMSAIETQYATDKAEWQRQVDAILAKFEQDFATAEVAREERVALAIAHADTAAGNANAAATQAGNVNAVLDGDNLTVTDRNGQSVTRNVRGPQGEHGASVTFFPAVTIFGQPHIEGPQISGFSANDYLQFPFVVNFAGRPWELHFDIATGADVSNQHNIFDSQFGLAFAFANGHFVMAMSSNGTSWNLGANEGTHAILPNQTYHIRMTWDGQTYKLAFATEPDEYTDDIVVASTASLYPRQIVIGKDIFTGSHFYNGSINFADARLTIAGVVVWEGMEEVGTATRMALDMSNIDEAGKAKLNEVAIEGEVGKKLNDLSSNLFDSLINENKSADEITLTDSSNIQVQGLTIYGKSVQNGIPTPESPAEIESTDAPTLTIANEDNSQSQSVQPLDADGNPIVLRGLEVTSGGNYTDENGIQWLCDTLEVKADGSGVITRNVFHQVDNGKQEDWRFSSSPSEGLYKFAKQVLSIKGGARRPPILCNEYVDTKTYEPTSNGEIVNDTQAAYNIRLVTNKATTVAEWKGLLGKNPIIIESILVTPTTENISAESVRQLLAMKTYKPITYASLDKVGGIGITYIADTKAYIDKRIAETQALALEN